MAKPELVGFLIDSFDRSDHFRKELTRRKIKFEQGREDNVLLISSRDMRKVSILATTLGVEWQWTRPRAHEGEV